VTRELAWATVHEPLPARSRLGPPSLDPRREFWAVTANELRRQARLAYVAGAEEWTHEHVGRPMTADEFRRVVHRAPG
jgi:hypothetical protein